jgi:hypothetical protein
MHALSLQGGRESRPSHWWRQEYGGLKGDQVKRLKDLEQENARLPASLSATEAKANNRPCSRLGWPVLRHAERGRNGGSYSIASNIYKANLMLNCGWRDAAHNL